jgi:hypothetical protein
METFLFPLLFSGPGGKVEKRTTERVALAPVVEKRLSLVHSKTGFLQHASLVPSQPARTLIEISSCQPKRSYLQQAVSVSFDTESFSSSKGQFTANSAFVSSFDSAHGVESSVMLLFLKHNCNKRRKEEQHNKKMRIGRNVAMMQQSTNICIKHGFLTAFACVHRCQQHKSCNEIGALFVFLCVVRSCRLHKQSCVCIATTGNRTAQARSAVFGRCNQYFSVLQAISKVKPKEQRGTLISCCHCAA